MKQANSNQISSFKDVESELTPLPALQTVYLEANPVQQELSTAYRRRIILTLPQIKQLDAT